MPMKENTDSRTVGDNLLQDIKADHDQEMENRDADQAVRDLISFLDPGRNVGDLISMDHDTAEVLIHDRLRQDVGGVPHGCLLLATRIRPDEDSLDPRTRKHL